MTEYLFLQPSIISGNAIRNNLFGIYDNYNISNNPQQADKKAIIAEVKAIYKDMAIACKEVFNEKKRR